MFAPTNEAFEQLSQAQLDELRNNPDALRAALGYHVIEGRYPVELLGDDLLTVNGALLKIVRDGTDVLVQDAPISKPDIFASNGVIHGISTFLTPPE